MDDAPEMFKIVVIGNSGTGKTNISSRYIKNQFVEGQKATVGVQFLAKVIKVHNQNIKVTLWDTAGQEKYKSLSKVYYKGSSGVLIVYDVTDPQSYLDVESWMRLVNQNLILNEIVLMVVGNKVDLEEERKVPTERPIRQYKEKFDIDCWEVSAKTGYNVKQVFAELVEKIYQMNIGPKDSHIPFGDSDIGESIIDGFDSVVANPKATGKTGANTGNNNRVSKLIPEVIIEEEDGPIDLKKDQKIPKNNQPQPAPPLSKKPTQEMPKKKENLKLTVEEEKKKKKQKKEKSCC